MQMNKRVQFLAIMNRIILYTVIIGTCFFISHIAVNGTNKIYVWNQFINISGVQRVAFDTTENGNLNFTSNRGVIDSVLRVHIFYIDDDENSSFQDVTFGPVGDNTVFVTFDTVTSEVDTETAGTSTTVLGQTGPTGYTNGAGDTTETPTATNEATILAMTPGSTTTAAVADKQMVAQKIGFYG